MQPTRPLADLAFSAACERNSGPILERLAPLLAGARCVLEIGSGTGQHAVHFARHLPWLSWQPTERPAQLPDLAKRIALEGPPNLRAPLALDVQVTPWPGGADVDAVFSANTLHIMSWAEVEACFAELGRLLPAGGTLCIYGPFRYRGGFTSESNAAFDASLRERDPASGIRDFEAVDALARAGGLTLHGDSALPANNQLLAWHRTAR
jgi:cyclopropane fatty-acyl-phospholipid synthase-like methyltransferase